MNSTANIFTHRLTLTLPSSPSLLSCSVRTTQSTSPRPPGVPAEFAWTSVSLTRQLFFAGESHREGNRCSASLLTGAMGCHYVKHGNLNLVPYFIWSPSCRQQPPNLSLVFILQFNNNPSISCPLWADTAKTLSLTELDTKPSSRSYGRNLWRWDGLLFAQLDST